MPDLMEERLSEMRDNYNKQIQYYEKILKSINKNPLNIFMVDEEQLTSNQVQAIKEKTIEQFSSYDNVKSLFDVDLLNDLDMNKMKKALAPFVDDIREAINEEEKTRRLSKHLDEYEQNAFGFDE